MKRVFLNLAALGIILCAGVSAATAQSVKGEKSTEPTAKEVIKQILSNGSIPLSSDPSCKSVGSSPTDKTVFDFVSSILSFQTEPDSKNYIKFSFTQEKTGKTGLVWVCDVLFYGEDGENVWNNGLRVKIRDSDRKLIRGSLMCTGTG